MTDERPDWDDQFAETDEEKDERWQRIKARRKAGLGWHDAAGEWRYGPTGPAEDEAGANRTKFEAALIALVAEFIGSLTGLRPPLERALFPPDQEPALNRLCDGII
jgi:hypothetical protein